MSEPYYISRGDCSAEVRTWRHYHTARQEFANRIIGVNANVDDLDARVDQNQAGVDARLDELNTKLGAWEAHLHAEQEEHFWGIQRQMDQARERYDRILLWAFLAILWLMLAWGWLGYEEAVAAQARADYLKRLWPVHAFFMRDRVMTVSWAQYYRFKAWFS